MEYNYSVFVLKVLKSTFYTEEIMKKLEGLNYETLIRDT